MSYQVLTFPAEFDLLDLHYHNPVRYPHLLQTSLPARHSVNFDILFAFPGESISLDIQNLRTQSDLPGGGFLDALDKQWLQAGGHYTESASELPFTGGWFLYLGYELVYEIEPHLPRPDWGDNVLPVAFATRFYTAVIRRKHDNRIFFVAEKSHRHLLHQVQQDIDNAPRQSAKPVHACLEIHEDPAEDYLRDVLKIKHYIRDGDIFQANLSRAWRLSAPTASYADIYQRLSAVNPAPFAALVTQDDMAIISSSPERLLRVKNNTIETRPIAGTRPRHADDIVDRGFSDELLAHPKERAEHIMLIDLERNDLGRVCEPGSITVDELMVLESYAHVHHIVSNIHGRLLKDMTPGRIIHAVFPGGTITGCPKVRCMEILIELEQEARGAYTGSVGYLNLDGSMDLNILIRTLVKTGSEITVRAGAGIVADSDPARELQETRAKAAGMLRALQADS